MQGRRLEAEVREHALAGGAVAGVVGGIVLALATLVIGVALGIDVWSMLKGAAAPFFHERALQPGFDAPVVVLGAACHFAVSIIWGVLFGALCYGLSRPATVLAGAGWGLVVWAGMSYVVLPLVGLGAMARATPTGVAIVQHVLFGLAVGLAFLPFQHRQAGGPAAGATRAASPRAHAARGVRRVQ
jgi:hypothetical protein